MRFPRRAFSSSRSLRRRPNAAFDLAGGSWIEFGRISRLEGSDLSGPACRRVRRRLPSGDEGAAHQEDRMRRFLGQICLSFFAAALFHSATALGQTAAQPPESIVTLVRISPGKHLDFLKWVAENDAINKEAGVPASQLYAHTSGDSWDYMQVSPVLTDAQQAKVDEVTKKRGRKTGFAGSLEYRTMVAWHSDTTTIGPVTAAQLVAEAAK
jgi:hypothetical protein